MREKFLVKYVVIACCTYKRPEKLKKLLESLSKINIPENIKTEILIVDNDKDRSAEKVLFDIGLTTHYFCEQARGLSNVRNTALNEAIRLGASHIAFIDDDEIADINWLVNHIDFYNRFENIYISSGPTYKQFEKEYPDYIRNNNVFKIYSKKNGTIRETCASGNVFFPLNIIEENNIYFSKDYNASGGEDTEFFARLSKAGYKIAWNVNAVNFEIVGDERANLKWILNRAFHNGYHLSLTKFLNSNHLLKRICYIIKKVIILPFDGIFTVLSILLGITKFVKQLTLFVKNLGKISGAISLKPNKYYA